MIISHKYKFIFVHVPKTAGTSIVQSLYPYLDLQQDVVLGGHPDHEHKDDEQRRSRGELHKHSTAEEIKEKVGEDIWNSYFVFGGVRNPYSRIVSLYNWWNKTPYVGKNKEKIVNMSFLGFVNSDLIGGQMVDSLCEIRKKKLPIPSDYKYNVSVDLIYKFEDVHGYFAYLCGLFNLPRIKLEKRNESYPGNNKIKYQDNYCPKSLNVVTEKFENDLALFGYPILKSKNGKLVH
tara:strand:+ start:7263 stop:7964 length:702 start_codon:yes stop_codon:yes gene_type:complete